jgi:hypothetical protein
VYWIHLVRTEFTGVLPRTRHYTFGFIKDDGISWPAERLLASHEGLYSIQISGVARNFHGRLGWLQPPAATLATTTTPLKEPFRSTPPYMWQAFCSFTTLAFAFRAENVHLLPHCAPHMQFIWLTKDVSSSVFPEYKVRAALYLAEGNYFIFRNSRCIFSWRYRLKSRATNRARHPTDYATDSQWGARHPELWRPRIRGDAVKAANFQRKSFLVIIRQLEDLQCVRQKQSRSSKHRRLWTSLGCPQDGFHGSWRQLTGRKPGSENLNRDTNI